MTEGKVHLVDHEKVAKPSENETTVDQFALRLCRRYVVHPCPSILNPILLGDPRISNADNFVIALILGLVSQTPS